MTRFDILVKVLFTTDGYANIMIMTESIITVSVKLTYENMGDMILKPSTLLG